MKSYIAAGGALRAALAFVLMAGSPATRSPHALHTVAAAAAHKAPPTSAKVALISSHQKAKAANVTANVTANVSAQVQHSNASAKKSQPTKPEASKHEEKASATTGKVVPQKTKVAVPKPAVALSTMARKQQKRQLQEPSEDSEDPEAAANLPGDEEEDRHHRPSHAARADPSSDASLRFMRGMAKPADDERETVPASPTEEQRDPTDIQKEVERMVSRVKRLGDPKVTQEFSHELADVESSLTASSSDTTLKTEISSVRAELCVTQGFGTDESGCEDFMKSACVQEQDNSEDMKLWKESESSGRNLTVSPEMCHVFFLKKNVVARKKAAVKAAAKAAAEPKRTGEEILGSKKIEDMPEQGYSGDMIKHGKDTSVDDWQKEFGPKAKHRSLTQICKDFPDNEWCRLHVYRPTQAPLFNSGAPRTAAVGILTVLLAAFCALQ